MNLDKFRNKNQLIRSSYVRERTPGRFAGTKILEIERKGNIPYYFNIKNLQCMTHGV